MSLLRRANRRFFYRHPRQILLAVLGIALGVAVVTGIDLSLASAQRAFQLSMEAVVGKATHRIIGGADGLDEALYAKLRVEHGWRDSAPVVEGYADYRNQTLRILGVDPFAENSLRGRFEKSAQGLPTTLISEPASVLLGRATATRFGLRVGDSLPLQIAGGTYPVKLVGLMEGDGPADPALEGLLLADIATAQELLGKIGRLDRIDLVLADASRQESALRAILPPGAMLRSAEGSGAAARLTAAFATNLRGMSALALLVGLFLVYHTVSFNLLQRRPLLATLRVLGATRGQILGEILLEAAALGLLGAMLGVGLALAAAQGFLQLVTRTINDVYFVLTVTHLYVSPARLAAGIALGVAAAVLAALPPALEAAWSRPAAAQRRSLLEARSRRLLLGLALTGAVLFTTAYGLLRAPAPLATATGAVLCLALGYSLATPCAVAVLAGGAARLCGRWGMVLPRLACRGIAGTPSRTGMAAAALALSVAMSVGTGVMIHSFRQAVEEWLERLIQADIHISLPSAPGLAGPTLPPELPGRAGALAGVAAVSTSLRTFVATSAGDSELLVFLPAYPDRPAYRFKDADGSRAWRDFLAGNGILVSEPYASRHELKTGDRLTIDADSGPVGLPVRGIFFDYRSEQGIILIHRGLYDRLWHNRAVSSLGLYLQAGADAAAVKREIQRRLAAGRSLIVRSDRELRANSLAIFDRTFTVTQVLRLQAVTVAFVGILSALLAWQTERGREFATLRAIGFTPGQITALVLLQTGLLGLVSGLLALPLGWLVGDALVRVVNLRSFGWTMDLALPVEVFAEAVILALAAALLAGVYPAWRAARLPPAAALREE